VSPPELDPRERDAILVALDQLEASSLSDDGWAAAIELVGGCLDALGSSGSHHGVDSGLGDLVTRLSVAGFQAQVQTRLGGPRRAAPAVAPTKRTPVLPMVGAVCAIGIGALGWAIGGGIVAAGTTLFALFVLGVALAGTHTAMDRRADHHSRTRPDDDTRPPSPQDLDALRRLRAAVDRSR
jgi:hypothetical protein